MIHECYSSKLIQKFKNTVLCILINKLNNMSLPCLLIDCDTRKQSIIAELSTGTNVYHRIFFNTKGKIL